MGKSLGVELRAFRPGEESDLLRLLAETHGTFHDAPGTRLVLSSERFDPKGCFIAEENGSTKGCIAVTRLPRDKWFVVRYLAVKESEVNAGILAGLLEKAVQYTRSEKAEYVRATTPAVEPYVTAYKQARFNPVRRDFRIAWNLGLHEHRPSGFEIAQLRPDRTGNAAESYVESLGPLWAWRTEEQGGSRKEAHSFEEAVKRGGKWLACQVEGRVVGLGGLTPDYYERGQARFRGAFVVPSHRGKGIGSALMLEIMNLAKKLEQYTMTVYTFSYLDGLAPGALLYLRSGGKIEAEYLQFQM